MAITIRSICLQFRWIYCFSSILKTTTTRQLRYLSSQCALVHSHSYFSVLFFNCSINQMKYINFLLSRWFIERMETNTIINRKLINQLLFKNNNNNVYIYSFVFIWSRFWIQIRQIKDCSELFYFDGRFISKLEVILKTTPFFLQIRTGAKN